MDNSYFSTELDYRTFDLEKEHLQKTTGLVNVADIQDKTEQTERKIINLLVRNSELDMRLCLRIS